MKGKEKCRILKEIRRQIAEQNEIEWVVSECRHRGDCRGTCPKCESEVRQLERELEQRRRFGKKVVLAGISAAFLMGLTGCSLAGGISEPDPGDMNGEVTYVEPAKSGPELDGAIPNPEEPTKEEIELDGDVICPEYE